MTARLTCIGGANMDEVIRLERVELGTSIPATRAASPGGVARNVAETAARLGAEVSFVGAVGDDGEGERVLAGLHDRGIDVTPVTVIPGRHTDRYTALVDADGELVIAANTMSLVDTLTPEVVLDRIAQVGSPAGDAPWVFAECNLSESTLRRLIAEARAGRIRLALDTISTPKAARLPDDLTGIDVLFTNAAEAAVLIGSRDTTTGESPTALSRELVARGCGAVVLTDGQRGHVVAVAGTDPVEVPALAATVVNVNGAGDALVAGTLVGVCGGATVLAASRAARRAVVATLASSSAAGAELSAATLTDP